MSRSLEIAQFTILFTGCLGILVSRQSSEQLSTSVPAFTIDIWTIRESSATHLFQYRIKHLFHTGMFHTAHINFLHVCSIDTNSQKKNRWKKQLLPYATCWSIKNHRDCAGQLVSLFSHSKEIKISLVSLFFASDSRSKATNSENHRSRRRSLEMHGSGWRCRQWRGLEMHG